MQNKYPGLFAGMNALTAYLEQQKRINAAILKPVITKKSLDLIDYGSVIKNPAGEVVASIVEQDQKIFSSAKIAPGVTSMLKEFNLKMDNLAAQIAPSFSMPPTTTAAELCLGINYQQKSMLNAFAQHLRTIGDSKQYIKTILNIPEKYLDLVDTIAKSSDSDTSDNTDIAEYFDLQIFADPQQEKGSWITEHLPRGLFRKLLGFVFTAIMIYACQDYQPDVMQGILDGSWECLQELAKLLLDIIIDESL